MSFVDGPIVSLDGYAEQSARETKMGTLVAKLAGE